MGKSELSEILCLPNIVVTLFSTIAKGRPSGEGIAPNISVVVERSRPEALPSSVTLRSALTPRQSLPQPGARSIRGPGDAEQFLP